MAFIGSSYREIQLICLVKLTETGVWPSSPLDLPYLFAVIQPGNILLQNSSGLPEKNFLSYAFLTTVREHLRDRFKNVALYARMRVRIFKRMLLTHTFMPHCRTVHFQQRLIQLKVTREGVDLLIIVGSSCKSCSSSTVEVVSCSCAKQR